MKKSIMIILVLFNFVEMASSQNLDVNRHKQINGFVNAVFKQNEDVRQIIGKFMQLPAVDSAQIEKQMTTIRYMLDTLKKDKTISENLNSYTIYSYDKYNKEKWLFSGGDNDIYIVDINGKAAIYFYFNADRIASFFIIRKGNYAFFLIV